MDLSFKPNRPVRNWTQECAMCGREVREGQLDIEIEYQEGGAGGTRARRVWHRSCHEAYLDSGEEI